MIRRRNLTGALPLSLAACVLLVAVYILLNSQTLEDVTGYRLLAIIASSMPISGYLGIFSVMMLENTSLPLPGSLFLPLAGYYVFVGKISFLGVLTASCLGSVIGSLIIFSMGLKFGAPRIYWVASKLGVSQESLARNEVRLIGRYGSALIFLSSFVPAFGSIIALPAAAVRTSTLKFVLLSLAGAVGSTTVYVLLGYSFSPILLEYNNFLSNLAIEYILYLFALVCAAYIGYYALKTLKVMRAKHVFIEKASESTR